MAAPETNGLWERGRNLDLRQPCRWGQAAEGGHTRREPRKAKKTMLAHVAIEVPSFVV